mgnify:CR=1 FL=1
MSTKLTCSQWLTQSLVLQIAKRQAVVNPENTFFSVKRFIGRKMEEVREESTQVPYKVGQCEEGFYKDQGPCRWGWTWVSCDRGARVVYALLLCRPEGASLRMMGWLWYSWLAGLAYRVVACWRIFLLFLLAMLSKPCLA